MDNNNVPNNDFNSASNNTYYNNAQNNAPFNAPPVIPEEYKPIGMWGYFGYEILFSIPCVGFIILLVFSFGGTKNINLRNFARSYFCFLIIAVVLAVILVPALIAGFTGYISTGSAF